MVGWEDAKAFCEWLTEKEIKEGVLPRNRFYRLPTDLEWSAAVGLPKEKGKTPEERSKKIRDVYPWGTEWPPPNGAGNYFDKTCREKQGGCTILEGYDDGWAETSPVGAFAVNRQGLYDMGGNVWELCEDIHDGRSRTRVTRGGSWHDGCPDELLSSCRNKCYPVGRHGNVGFRCVVRERLAS